MVDGQPAGTGPLAPGCSLVAGVGPCRCAAEAPGLTDAEIAYRAREKVSWQQGATPTQRRAARRGLDDLLAYVRARGPADLVMELLRNVVQARFTAADAAENDDVEPLLGELAEIGRASCRERV